MNINHESHAISRRSFLKASGVVGAAGSLRRQLQQLHRCFFRRNQRPQHHRRYSVEGVHLLGEHQP